ncbi:Gx transporter family protein [Lactobacillus sp. IBH004]|uniref:Heptaprenyl diphosphate synthase n=1 Tax=Lactobacillus melliventris TaxID=1218507 RepID=A0A0F4LHK6_9LACO|nr:MULTISPECIES: Gx transporter family protein [Lactobacillus]KJY57744.1 Trans-hexaprenyltranstransferase subunit I [Lactobacillus melliventris]MBC6349435.1 Gx transporter family protein [Lactobacillus melliventris]PXY86198.1 heptaprenyl diphosphate synthase [Lactobacillus melliventris]RMC60050.1 Gx transporter family protein [Lactobacillus sp. ESL0260]RMC62090.1 Gx transporter family protein [Lactobacillus sp. ESL0259]
MTETNNYLRTYVFTGILCSQGIILSVVEQMFPSPFFFAPGARLGLTNIITMIALMILPFNNCILLTFLRLVLTALMTGGTGTFLFAAAGSFLSLFLMKLFLPLVPRFISIMGVSILGGVCHNFGQLLIAALLAHSKYVLLYLPLLTVFGILSGTIVGLVSSYLLHYVDALSFIKGIINKGN